MFLYGASGHAKVIMDILQAQNEPIEGLIDDNPDLKELMGIPVSHSAEKCSPIIVSIGINAVRKKIAERLQTHFGRAIHPAAIISPQSEIDEGTVVMQGAIIQSCAKVGKHCIINTGASVDHDCHLGNYVHIAPHATLCGNVTVEEGSWIGAGAVVIPGIHIGKWSIVGAGAVVIQDLPDGVIAVGNPCHIIKQK